MAVDLSPQPPHQTSRNRYDILRETGVVTKPKLHSPCPIFVFRITIDVLVVFSNDRYCVNMLEVCLYRQALYTRTSLMCGHESWYICLCAKHLNGMGLYSAQQI